MNSPKKTIERVNKKATTDIFNHDEEKGYVASLPRKEWRKGNAPGRAHMVKRDSNSVLL
jgi:hypothetical protein